MHQANKQQGVVLISALIFLLLTIIVLQFSLQSAEVQERKAGIDIDLTQARESANLAIETAAKFVIAEGRDKWEPDTFKEHYKNADGYAHILDASDASKLPCGAKPAWQCVNWGSKFHLTKGSASSITPKAVTIAEGAGKNLIPPQYIIERLKIDKTVVLRVTAVGYGLPSDDGNVTNVMLQANYIVSDSI